ncbi:MAG: DUF4870 domain-containing protein [Phaeodactylibacter sp.]|nr:DUF4870 domain-containing protein [Phaeodactylibacter sp.]
MQEPLDSHETREGLIPDKDELMWSTFAHLGFVAGMVIPFGNVIAPLVIWLVFKDRSSYVDYHGKEALNFQITVTLAMIASGILILLLIGIFLLIAVVLLALVFSIMGAIKANNGEYYEYPFTIRFIR